LTLRQPKLATTIPDSLEGAVHHGDDEGASAAIQDTAQPSNKLEAPIASTMVLPKQVDDENCPAKAEPSTDAQPLSSLIISDSLLASDNLPSPPRVEITTESTTNVQDESNAQQDIDINVSVDPERSLVIPPLSGIPSTSSALAKSHIKRENSDVDVPMVAGSSQGDGASQKRRSGSILGKRRKSHRKLIVTTVHVPSRQLILIVGTYPSKRRRSGPASDAEVIDVSDDENDEIAVEDSIVVAQVRRKRPHSVEIPLFSRSEIQESSTPKPAFKRASPPSVRGQRKKVFDAVEIRNVKSKRCKCFIGVLCADL
jgi:hypothetical protein